MMSLKEKKVVYQDVVNYAVKICEDKVNPCIDCWIKAIEKFSRPSPETVLKPLNWREVSRFLISIPKERFKELGKKGRGDFTCSENRNMLRDNLAKAICQTFGTPEIKECICADKDKIIEGGTTFIKHFCPRCKNEVKITKVEHLKYVF